MRIEHSYPALRRLVQRIAGIALAVPALACYALEGAKPPEPDITSSHLLGKNEHYAVVRPGENDTVESLAERYLGDSAKAWKIVDANDPLLPGLTEQIVIPLNDENRTGIFADGFQVVPVLTYHRFEDEPHRLAVKPEEFARQMAYLHAHQYRVIKLSALEAFLRGEQTIPRRSVVITIDDGYLSTFTQAFPVLLRYNFPATVFIYTDFIDNGGLTWAQIETMHASGLVSIQPHSKSHSNLSRRRRGESEHHYLARLEREVAAPKAVLERRLNNTSTSYAYPFGAANVSVVDLVRKHDYSLALTVDRGSNPSFAYPYALRRSMVYGGTGMRSFLSALEVYRQNGDTPPVLGEFDVNQAEASALAWSERGDLARALRSWRIADALRPSAETTRAMRSLETSIAAKAKRLLAAAERHLNAGQTKRAVTLALASLALEPNRGEAKLLLKSIYAERSLSRLDHRFAPPRPAIDLSLPEMLTEEQQKRSRPMTEVERAAALRGNGDFEAALLELLRAQASGRGANTQLDEQFNLTRTAYARALYERGADAVSVRPEQAVDLLKQAVFHDPDHLLAKRMLAYAQQKARRGRQGH